MISEDVLNPAKRLEENGAWAGVAETTALDQLETCLQSGSDFILGQASRYPRLSTADPDITSGVYPHSDLLNQF